MPFRNVFIAVTIGTALLVAAFMINENRPPVVTEQPTASLVRTSGKCAECNSNQRYSVVHEYELSEPSRLTGRRDESQLLIIMHSFSG